MFFFCNFLRSFLRYRAFPTSLKSTGSSSPFPRPLFILLPMHSASILPYSDRNSKKSLESSIGTWPTILDSKGQANTYDSMDWGSLEWTKRKQRLSKTAFWKDRLPNDNWWPRRRENLSPGLGRIQFLRCTAGFWVTDLQTITRVQTLNVIVLLMYMSTQ